MTFAGNVGNWMILFGGKNLSPVTGSWSHPIPNFTIATWAAFWRTLVLTLMYAFPKKICQAGIWETAVRFLFREWGREEGREGERKREHTITPTEAMQQNGKPPCMWHSSRVVTGTQVSNEPADPISPQTPHPADDLLLNF